MLARMLVIRHTSITFLGLRETYPVRSAKIRPVQPISGQNRCGLTFTASEIGQPYPGRLILYCKMGLKGDIEDRAPTAVAYIYLTTAKRLQSHLRGIGCRCRLRINLLQLERLLAGLVGALCCSIRLEA